MAYLDQLIKSSKQKVEEKPEKEKPSLNLEDWLEGALPKDRQLIEEYGVCKIFRIPGHKQPLYAVPVPRSQGPERMILDTIKEAATRLITIPPEKFKDPKERREFYKKRILEIIEASPELGIPATRKEFYAETVMREMIGYGPLDLLLQDDNLEEIMVIGPNRPVYVFHRKYEMCKTNVIFSRDDDIKAIIDRIARDVGRRIDIQVPLLDARLPDGSRVNATIPPISLNGSTITIRKFREDPFTVVDMIKNGTLNSELAAFLWLAVEGMSAKPANILISGGTGSGKTTMLNVLASFIPKTERVITIEDTAELKLPIEHWVRFETRPPSIEGTGEVDMNTLIKNSLRMRPDRVIVGEIRGEEAFTLFTAMNTGHDGCMGTVHANNSKETLVRITNPPMNVPSVMVSALDMIIVMKRIHDRRKGTIRRVTEVAEVTGVLEGTPQVIYLYEWDPVDDKIRSTGVPSKFLQTLERFTGMTHAEIIAEIGKRKEFLEGLVKKGTRDLDSVSRELDKYLAGEYGG